MLSALLTTKAAAVALAVTAVSGTVAAAATGNLPGTSHRPAAHGSQQDAADTSGADQPSTSHGKGSAVSELATTTTLTGRDKGAAVSALASGGKSHAGDVHGKPDTTGKPSDAGKPNTAGRPSDAARPDTTGKPSDAGKPDTTGKPSDAGRPGDAGAPSAGS